MTVTRLAAVGLTVPRPAETASFLRKMLDFEVVEAGDRIHLTAEGEYGRGTPPRLLTLFEGAELAVQGITFECATREELAAVRDRLSRVGIRWSELTGDAHDQEAIGFEDPEGLRVACALASAPMGHPLAHSALRPRRLGHVNLKVGDAGRIASFYQEALGLRLSEQIGELLFFLRVGSDHHNLGLRGGADRANVHHVAFEVAGWESFRVICDHIAEHGHTVEYGPGRHGPGHNLFVYLIEPSSGLRIELFADMAHIDDETYQAVRWDAVDRARTVNRWGPQPPHSFLE